MQQVAKSRVRGQARIMKDLKSVQGNPNIQFTPKNEDKLDEFLVKITFTGDRYKGQTHILNFKTVYGAGPNPYIYPLHPPLVKFLTKIYHVNISSEGSICLDILKEGGAWSPQNSFETVIKSIEALIEDPNNASPFNGDASREWVKCEKAFKEAKSSKKLTVQEEEILKNQCFESFDARSNVVAKSNAFGPFKAYFDV